MCRSGMSVTTVIPSAVGAAVTKGRTGPVR